MEGKTSTEPPLRLRSSMRVEAKDYGGETHLDLNTITTHNFTNSCGEWGRGRRIEQVL